MKLLLCTLCQDVKKLAESPTHCECGMSSGQYLSDGWNAKVKGPHAQVIGLNNRDLLDALGAIGNTDAGYRTIRAWVMGLDAPRVKRE
jgi:hypothetical protein